MTPPSPSPVPTVIKRYITTHDQETGKAIFSKVVPPEIQPNTQIPGLYLYNAYSTSTFPTDLSNDGDIPSYLFNNPDMSALGSMIGNAYQVVEIWPAARPSRPPVMHRTVSIDIGVILEGSVELLLDSGETRTLGKGDVVVQRGTMHAWRNVSETEVARIFFVASPIKPVVVKNGKEELGFEHPVMSR
ncbi:hypothetical protein B0H66DRAFT_634838 [Apodospora peruviana]|uniref:Cupin type-2 domain-containing protein n=1 Tax=Apodospora peruviana TaxID=516989 RepID=A0AAE0IQZ3_9PEZI|nr:hypothetical protein B0H66DRAFT_634838 [Apodospora peruviana]